MINKRWKITIRDVRTKPGADCGTDHELLVATLKTKLKKLRKKGDRTNAYDCKGITPEYRVDIKNRFKILVNPASISTVIFLSIPLPMTL